MKFPISCLVVFAAIGCVTGGVFSCSVVNAQWKPDRLATGGPGLKVGSLEFHPGVALRAGYDSNVYKGDDEAGSGTAGQSALGVGTLSVSPHFKLMTETGERSTQGDGASATPTPGAISFSLGAGASYNYALSDKVPSNVDVDSDLFLAILPARATNLVLGANFVRSTRPFAQAVFNSDNGTYAVDNLKPTATLNVGTSSKVLTGFVTYAPNFRYFEDEVNFRFLSTFGHQVDAGTGWKFFPQTSLVSVLSYQTNAYIYDKPANVAVLLSDGTAFKTKVGINGAVTTNFIFRALAGYAVGFYDDKQLEEFEDVIGELNLGFRIGSDDTISVGYNRDIVPSPGGAWVRTDRANAAAVMKFSNFGLTLEAGYSYLTYGDMVALELSATNPPQPTGQLLGLGIGSDPFKRRDNRVDAAIRAQYDITQWFALLADATVQATITDFDYNVITGGSSLPDPAGYTAFQFYGGTRLLY